jgi:hypothetical protein
MKFDTFNKLISYLEDNLYTTDFINLHTRPELVEILKLLYPKTNFKRGMCKVRQVKHIEFWLNLHNRECKK